MSRSQCSFDDENMSAKRIPFEQYTPVAHGNLTVEDCREEVRRELNVRRRVYDRWLAKGDMTWQEGDGRMRAMLTVLRILNELPNDHPIGTEEHQPIDTEEVSNKPY